MVVSDIISFLYNGTLQGAVLALVAMGYSLVYGVGHVMNLAHGAYFMVTGYLLLTMATYVFPGFGGFIEGGGESLGLGLLMIVIALVIVTVIGGLSYLLLIKPLQSY